MAKSKKDQVNPHLNVGGATEVDEDGQNDTDYNEELEDDYEDVEQENDVKSNAGDEDTVEYDSDENIDGDENVDAEEEIGEDVDEDDPEIGEDVDLDENAQTVEESDGCMYNFAKKKTDDDSDDDFDEQIFDDDNVAPIENNSKIVIVTGDERISGSRMTKYERVRILAERSKQLMGGAKHMLKGTEGMSIKEIARAELNMGVIPYRIRRERPDGKIEEWKISELEIGN